MMLGLLIRNAHLFSLRRRRGSLYFWFIYRKSTISFLAVLGLPVLVLTGIVYVARLESLRVAPAGIVAGTQESTSSRRRAGDLQCLARNIYFEARGEPLEGQYAVAEVTLNRRWAVNFPRTICEVVYESRWDPNRGRQVADFSWTELGTLKPPDGPAWRQAMAVASAAYDDLHEPVVPGALYYHASNVRPEWARSRTPVATIGNHIFYR